MTLCAAAISEAGVYMTCDCRVTFANGLVSDSLLKLVPIGQNAAMCVAGDVDTIAAIIKNLNLSGLQKKRHKPVTLVRSVCRDIVRLYHDMKCAPKQVQFLIACATSGQRAISKVLLPNSSSELNMKTGVGAVFAIGEDDDMRRNCENHIQELDFKAWGSNLPFIMGNICVGAKNIQSLHAGVDRDKQSVSRVFACFDVSERGVDLIKTKVEMFRGRIADRNKPLGYALDHEIDVEDGRLVLIDHQANKRIALRGPTEFDYKGYGVVSSNRNPYTLK